VLELIIIYKILVQVIQFKVIGLIFTFVQMDVQRFFVCLIYFWSFYDAVSSSDYQTDTLLMRAIDSIVKYTKHM